MLFKRTEESTKALVDLDKRFFGGRVVHATFFDKERFGPKELAPMQHLPTEVLALAVLLLCWPQPPVPRVRL